MPVRHAPPQRLPWAEGAPGSGGTTGADTEDFRDGVVRFGPEPADDHRVWWLWVVGGLVAWIVVACALAVIIGRSVRLADQRSGAPAVLTTANVPAPARAAATAAAAPVRERRRAVPLPTFAVVLVAVALALETTGYVLRLTGATGASAQLLSMDSPFSLPRMFVAGLFAAAALAAVAGAGAVPGRRTWWLAVGAIAGGIAMVKAGGSIHADALKLLDDSLGTGLTMLVSALAAGSVVGALWVLSRTERRDRRRVLGVLALYAAASVGLSAVSSLAAGAYGSASKWAAGATFLEETGEALAGVAFLVAVLVGVAPRLALPARWALRREADAHTLDLPERLPGQTVAGGGFTAP